MITWSDIAALLSTLYWGSMVLLLLGAVVAVFMLTKEGKRRVQLLSAVLVGIPCAFYLYPKFYQTVVNRSSAEERAAMARYKQAKAIFDERCKTAGEQIYRTASDVEGITLLNVPKTVMAVSTSTYDPWKDPMWPDAALVGEAWGDSYIASFLDKRERLLGKPNNITEYIGFSFVDVKAESDQYFRYRWNTLDKMHTDEFLVSELVQNSISRYAISYKPLIAEEDRQYWIAGAAITIIDQEKQEIMATKTWYALEPELGNSKNHRKPWLFVLTCPQDGTDRQTISRFVRRIIQPKP